MLSRNVASLVTEVTQQINTFMLLEMSVRDKPRKCVCVCVCYEAAVGCVLSDGQQIPQKALK